MSFLFLTRTSAVLGIGLGLSTLHPLSPFRQTTPIQCQYNVPYTPNSQHQDPSWAQELPQKQQPLKSTGLLTPSNMRQISLGSVLGLVAGVGLRAFSRALVVLLGMGIVLVEWAAAKGYNLVPVGRMQRFVKGVDLQGLVSRHVPFKMTFGGVMVLAAFAQF